MTRILWVDDDVYDIQYLLHKVESAGVAIDKYMHLPEAYENLAKASDQYDLVVIDLLMPRTNKHGEIPQWLSVDAPQGANGINFLRLMRNELDVDIPVLVLSIVGPEAIADLEIYSPEFQPLKVIRKTPENLKYLTSTIEEMLNASPMPSL